MYAHLPGMVAAKTTLPVIGVPVKSRALSGVDSLYSIVQMPGELYLSQPWLSVKLVRLMQPSCPSSPLSRDKGIADPLANFAEEQGKIAEESTNELN